MDAILFIGFHVVMMTIFLVMGIYQFGQIEDKDKRRRVDRTRTTIPIAELDIDEAALRHLVRAEQYDNAVQQLMADADVDKFTAQSIVETLKKQEYRPYISTD
jgi:hypothetical protein